MTNSAVDQAKATVREQVRLRRRELRDVGRAERSALAARYANTLISHLATHQPGTITAYESWATEPPTEALIAGLIDQGWRVLVPDTLPDLDLSWHEAGRPEVDLGVEAIAQADVLLIPGLSVDHDGYRLGQGGGCYDRALLRARPGAPVIAMIFDHELLDSVPREPHDCRVDAVLTADALITPAPPTGTITP